MHLNAYLPRLLLKKFSLRLPDDIFAYLLHKENAGKLHNGNISQQRLYCDNPPIIFRSVTLIILFFPVLSFLFFWCANLSETVNVSYYLNPIIPKLHESLRSPTLHYAPRNLINRYCGCLWGHNVSRKKKNHQLWTIYHPPSQKNIKNPDFINEFAPIKDFCHRTPAGLTRQG